MTASQHFRVDREMRDRARRSQATRSGAGCAGKRTNDGEGTELTDRKAQRFRGSDRPEVRQRMGQTSAADEDGCSRCLQPRLRDQTQIAFGPGVTNGNDALLRQARERSLQIGATHIGKRNFFAADACGRENVDKIGTWIGVITSPKPMSSCIGMRARASVAWKWTRTPS